MASDSDEKSPGRIRVPHPVLLALVAFALIGALSVIKWVLRIAGLLITMTLPVASLVILAVLVAFVVIFLRRKLGKPGKS